MTYSYKRLWKLLIDKGITEMQLAQLAGVSKNIVAKMVKNESVSMDTLIKIYTALKCGLDDIVELTERMPDSNNIQCIKQNKPQVISLFSGAGGLDIGFENAGFSIAVAVEVDPACCDTLHTNRPDLPIINKSIVDVTAHEILSTAHMHPLEPALVIGGPPCQSFSLAGLRKGLEDERGKLLFEFVRIVREVLPVGFVLENVKGLTNWDAGRALKLLIDELSKPIEYQGKTYSYSIKEPKVLNAVDYGVPQYRERLILLGNRKGMSFEYPPETNKKTVWDAIGNLPKPQAPSDMARIVAQSIKGRREKHGY